MAKAQYTNYKDQAVIDLNAKIFNKGVIKAFTYDEMDKGLIKYKITYGHNGYNMASFTVMQLEQLVIAFQTIIKDHKKTFQGLKPEPVEKPKPEKTDNPKPDLLASLEIAYKNKWIDKTTYDAQKKALSDDNKPTMSEEDKAQLQAIADMFKNGFMSESKAKSEKAKIMKKYKL